MAAFSRTSADHLERELTRLFPGQTQTGLTTLQSLCRRKLRTRPTIFLAHALAGNGDILPYLQVVVALAGHLSGTYHALLLLPDLQIAEAFATTFAQLPSRARKSVTVYYAFDDWLQTLQQSDQVDAVITNQEGNMMGPRSNAQQKRQWAKIYRAMEEKQSLSVKLEFLWCGAGLSADDACWSNKLATGRATLDEYRMWRFITRVDKKKAQVGMLKTLPRVLLECFPAKLLSEQEIQYTSGILCGQVPPLLQPTAFSKPLLRFLDANHKNGRHILLLARGGIASLRFLDRAVDPNSPPLIAQHLLKAIKNLSIICLDARAPVSGNRVHRHILVLRPYAVDFAKLLPEVEVILHHGGAGTTLTALEAGVPQVIVPNAKDSVDQLSQGWRVEQLGCGILCRPSKGLNVETGFGEIVQAVHNVLAEQVRERAVEFREELVGANREEEVPLAVLAIVALVKGSMGQKGNGEWDGWTKKFIDSDAYAGSYERTALRSARLPR